MINFTNISRVTFYFVFLLVWLFSAGFLFATTTSTKITQTAVNNSVSGTYAWGTPGNAQADDNVCTISFAAPVTNYLDCRNFGFTSADVPSGSIIRGVTVVVEVTRKIPCLNNGDGGLCSMEDYEVKLVKAGVISGTSQAVAGDWTQGACLSGGG